ncbi:hypothetical protein ACEQ8H_007828 [Pleosporales sp. CAS-2024a]
MASNHATAHPDALDMDSLLTLEDALYTSAYGLGAADGARAGRIQGRFFGLEKGFEKFAALGELHARSAVWGARALTSSVANIDAQAAGKDKMPFPPLPQSARLLSNITLLHSLTDPLTFSTDNTDEAVADFDHRLKRAAAKAKVVERLLGQPSSVPDASPVKARLDRLQSADAANLDRSIEDFAGSRLLR